MKQTIMGVVIGAVVATGVSILLAQTPNWTTPRTWVTDDLLTAGQFNAQFRDNLLWLRTDAQRTGTDALDDLGCGTRGSGQVLYSDCDWAALPAGVVFDIHDDITQSATIVDADRVPFSDESASGDPMRYATAANLANYMQGEVELNANRVTAGTFGTARIPNLDASKINAGTFGTARIPGLPASQTTSGTFSTARIPNLNASKINAGIFDAARIPEIEDDAVGRDQLRTASMNQSGTSRFYYPGNGYAFWPVPTGDENCSLNTASTGDAGRWVWRNDTGGTCDDGSISMTMRYLTSSDTPSLWVVLDASGAVTDFWEAEDPISTGDTVPPLGTDEPGHTVVDVGLPSLAVIESVYTAALTSDQRTAALTCTGDYVTKRGWLTTFTTLADLATIEARYRPSGRQWAMRCGAQASNEGVPTFYQGALVVSSGVWSVAP